MAGTSSINGMVSGLDTASIISQLMQVESGPQTLLKNQVSTQQSNISTLQSLNSQFASLATKANALATAVSWSPTKATSSSDGVTVTADAGATATSFSFTVSQVATSYSEDFGTGHKLDDKVTTDGSTSVFVTKTGGTEATEIKSDGTIQGLANAINAGNYGLKASLLQVSKDNYRLQISATATGTSSRFTLTGKDGADLAITGTSTDGKSAEIKVGTDTIDSESNTFTDLMPGVDVTLTSSAPITPAGSTTPTPVTITVSQDTATASSAAKSLVDAANSILSTIDKLTAYDATTQTSGPLAGDATIRSLRNAVLDSVTNAVDNRSLAPVGIELQRDGTISFDASKFATAYAANPSDVASVLGGTSSWTGTGTATLQSATWRTAPGAHSVNGDLLDQTAGTRTGKLLTGASGTKADGLTVNTGTGASGTLTYVPGFAARLEALAQQASDSTVGTLTSDITGMQSSVTRMQSAISDWDVRLAAKQTALQKQFSDMEVALGKLQNQASWLSGQITSLATNSSSS